MRYASAGDRSGNRRTYPTDRSKAGRFQSSPRVLIWTAKKDAKILNIEPYTPCWTINWPRKICPSWCKETKMTVRNVKAGKGQEKYRHWNSNCIKKLTLAFRRSDALEPFLILPKRDPQLLKKWEHRAPQENKNSICTASRLLYEQTLQRIWQRCQVLQICQILQSMESGLDSEVGQIEPQQRKPERWECCIR